MLRSGATEFHYQPEGRAMQGEEPIAGFGVLDPRRPALQ